MARYEDYGPRIDHTIELRGVYDGWSIAVLTDGTLVNRWANDADDGAEPGYERRFAATQVHIDRMRVCAESSIPEHGPDWSDWGLDHPEEGPSCKCGFNGSPEECASSRALATEPTDSAVVS